VLITLLVGITCVGTLSTTADSFNIGTTPTAYAVNATISEHLFSNVYGAFNLSILIPIVAGAGALLTIAFAAASKTLPDKEE